MRDCAYQLEDENLLIIRRHRGRDIENDRVGLRNESNEFDLTPFVNLVEAAWTKRRQAKQNEKIKRRGGA